MIEVKNISIGYHISRSEDKVVHSGLTFKIADGELTALLGANGAGKSTLIKSLTGFTPLLSGEVLIGGRSLDSFTKSELSREIGVVLTSRPADGGLTIFDLVSFGRYPYTDYFGTLRGEDIEIIEDAMESVGVLHLRDSYVSRVSDGERQKAMIAKVLAQQCKTIILDEPTAFLDVKSRLETYSLLRKIAHEQGKSILLSTHDLEITLRHADTLLIVPKVGAPIIGTTEDMVFSGKIETLFGGGDSVSSRSDLTYKSGDSMVEFDDSDGSFRIKNGVKGVVTLNGDDDKLMFWVRNGLIRNGYETTLNSNGDQSVLIVKKDEFILNGEVVCRSVKELIEAINH